MECLIIPKMYAVILLIFIVACICVLLLYLKRNNKLVGSGRVIIPKSNDHGICYIICAANMLLDCRYVRDVLPKHHELRKVLNGDYTMFDNAQSGGSAWQIVKDYLNELPDIRDKVRFIINSESEMSRMPIRYSLDKKYILTGIIYTVYEEMISDAVMYDPMPPPNPEHKYPHNHVVYVSYDDYTDNWVMLSDDEEYILTNPILEEDLTTYTLHSPKNAKGLYPSIVKYMYPSASVLRYELPRTKSSYTTPKLTLKERFKLSREESLATVYFGSEHLFDKEPDEEKTEDDIRAILTIN